MSCGLLGSEGLFGLVSLFLGSLCLFLGSLCLSFPLGVVFGRFSIPAPESIAALPIDSSRRFASSRMVSMLIWRALNFGLFGIFSFVQWSLRFMLSLSARSLL